MVELEGLLPTALGAGLTQGLLPKCPLARLTQAAEVRFSNVFYQHMD